MLDNEQYLVFDNLQFPTMKLHYFFFLSEAPIEPYSNSKVSSFFFILYLIFLYYYNSIVVPPPKSYKIEAQSTYLIIDNHPRVGLHLLLFLILQDQEIKSSYFITMDSVKIDWTSSKSTFCGAILGMEQECTKLNGQIVLLPKKRQIQGPRAWISQKGS